MNARIRNLFGLVVVLFAVLIGFTSYWSVFHADELEANRANKRPLLEQQQIRRGLIVAARRDRARAQPRAVGRLAALLRAALSRRAACSRIPWVTASWSVAASGLEREYNDDLTGKTDEFSRSSTRCAAASARATTCSRTSTRRRSRWRATASPAAPARWSRSTRAPGACA